MKRKKAAAVEYNKGYTAPVVTAIGFGEIADKILSIAKDNDIPVIENNMLAEELCKLNINEDIPLDLYKPVAEIIAFIYKVNADLK
jgi:flagellar biosynthesis protein